VLQVAPQTPLAHVAVSPAGALGHAWQGAPPVPQAWMVVPSWQFPAASQQPLGQFCAQVAAP
jgi:hypothetical protein